MLCSSNPSPSNQKVAWQKLTTAQLSVECKSLPKYTSRPIRQVGTMGWFSGVKSLHCQCIGFEGKTKRRLETARITWRASSKPDMDAFFSATSAPDIPLGHFAKGLPVILGKNGLKPASPTQINTYQGIFNACVALISTHPKALWKICRQGTASWQKAWSWVVWIGSEL